MQTKTVILIKTNTFMQVYKALNDLKNENNDNENTFFWKYLIQNYYFHRTNKSAFSKVVERNNLIFIQVLPEKMSGKSEGTLTF